MNTKSTLLATLLAAFFSLTAPGYATGLNGASTRGFNSEVIWEFADGLYKRNRMKMVSVVEKNTARIPAEVDMLLDQTLTHRMETEEKEARFYVLERLANEYKSVTGDSALLARVKRRIFEDKLSMATSPEDLGGLHIVEGIKTDAARNIFKPDNIVIQSGETIRWVNNDTRAQMLTSVMTTIGKKGISSPMIEPGQSWEHTFYAPGEYYYISLLHKEMYGKIVVERSQEQDIRTGGPGLAKARPGPLF